MRKILAGASTAALLALTACSIAPTSTVNSGHNAADISFARQMIPHHRQAVEMADLVPNRATDPKVKNLATRIKQAQDPEIQQLTDMLTRWNALPQGANPSSPGQDMTEHGSMEHGGMDTGQLEAATGAEFDRLWVELMIEHHQGAVDMARTEVATGSDPAAKALAQRIIDAQQAEITEMQAMMRS